MSEKFKYDRDGRLVTIEKPVPIRFVINATCGGDNRQLHRGVWQLDSFERRIENIHTRSELVEHLEGWTNEVLHQHELTDCIQRPRITIAAGQFTFDI